MRDEPFVRISKSYGEWVYFIEIIDGFMKYGSWLALTLKGAERKGSRQLRKHKKHRDDDREWVLNG